jgi:hypothetical protein
MDKKMIFNGLEANCFQTTLHGFKIKSAEKTECPYRAWQCYFYRVINPSGNVLEV